MTLTAALAALAKAVTIPTVLLLIIPALMVLAAGVVMAAVLMLRMIDRTITSENEVAISRVERLLKAGSAAVAEVLAARQRRGASLSEVKGRPTAEG